MRENCWLCDQKQVRITDSVEDLGQRLSGVNKFDLVYPQHQLSVNRIGQDKGIFTALLIDFPIQFQSSTKLSYSILVILTGHSIAPIILLALLLSAQKH